MKHGTILGPGLLLFAACAVPRPVPPEPAPPGLATFVAASFDLTWTATLDQLATAGIPAASVDRRSGAIVTEEVAFGPVEALEYADCGARSGQSPALRTAGDRYAASSATYHIQVTDDGVSASSVLVTATLAPSESPFPCETTRVWEDEAQEAIRLAAEVNR